MSFNSLLINHCRVKTKTPGDWSEPTETIGPVLKCRIMYKTKRITDYKGEERISLAKVFLLPSDLTFSHMDELQFDAEGYAIDHAILLISKPQDSTHLHHGEVWVA